MKKDKGIFQFKQFSVSHKNSTMRVGTDAVVLGSWVDVTDQSNILEVGTGCGIIALMIAQRNAKATIDAIDIDDGSVEEALSNFKNSVWSDRLTAKKCSFQHFEPAKKYDHIVSNPPFFGSGTKSPISKRHNARHTNTLTFEELVKRSKELLSAKGNLSIIIPHEALTEMCKIIDEQHLAIQKQLNFKAKEATKIERVLLTIGRDITTLEENTMYQYNTDGTWSEEYKNLTKDYYLKL
ncbi:tRNA1(Val) (adenine(37)-N6)-methyltransferase [Fulvivirga lutea]|uniref:tRNA1(Val) (adenine(37)-N6)-methyltransferase n=1 Tax=Fulvivirga lutea TaxID=2810512 RepID=A0A975A2R9_9BACT|nr:methyltransferase [Fulvivirga lutea]QSE99131.1 methyltransferase [Fulvivirga lutea]